MVEFHLICNCQFDTITLLLQKMIANVVVKGIDLSVTDSHDEKFLASTRSALHNADYILIQPNAPPPLDCASINQAFPNKTFIISSFFFRGLHPDCCYVGSRERRLQRPTAYNSIVVLDAFKRRLSEKKALKAFNIENFQRLGLLDAWDSSIEEMRKQDSVANLPSAGLIDSCCREFPAFFTMNHPSLGMVYEYMVRVLDQLGVRYKPLNPVMLSDPLKDHDIVPVYDEIAEYYDLPYRTSQRWLIRDYNRRFVDREEYIQQFYSVYSKVDLDILTVHSPHDLLAALKNNRQLSHLVDTSVIP